MVDVEVVGDMGRMQHGLAGVVPVALLRVIGVVEEDVVAGAGRVVDGQDAHRLLAARVEAVRVAGNIGPARQLRVVAPVAVAVRRPAQVEIVAQVAAIVLRQIIQADCNIIHRQALLYQLRN